jgi:electron transport complex protein RnfD
MTTWVKPGRANWAGLLSGTVGMNGAELATGATP